MTKRHHPRRGSTQFWPRKRANHSLARIRAWAKEDKTKLLGFICYKAGMTRLQVVDNRPKSTTKGEKIAVPVTIIECPPMKVMGIAFYKKSFWKIKKITSVLATNLDKELKRKMPLPKKPTKSVDDVKDFDDLRLLVHSNPKLTGIGTKKPKVLEIALGGSKEDKLNFAKEHLGKELKINDVFESGVFVDIHGISTGKGYQGTVKRYGVPIRQHKAEKTKRGIGNLGAWTPKRVDFRVPQPGKMGYHLRTEYNKQIIKVGENGQEITPKGGKLKYGVIKNPYLLIKGTVIGPKKRAVVLTQAIRPNPKAHKEAPEVAHIRIK